MAYIIEIELPSSGAWFKYFINIESLEEAESITQAAEGSIKTRILKNAWHRKHSVISVMYMLQPDLIKNIFLM